MKPLYISFYTCGTPYESEAMELGHTCWDLGLETLILGIPNCGNWTANCARKPHFIRDHMRRDRPLVWLDADARVRQYPALFDSLECDFAAHWRHGAELLSGTTYWGPTENARKLADAWCVEQSKHPREWDQRVLQRVIERGDVPGLIIRHLPKEYTAVWDDPKMGNEETWVISHHQASRRLAKAV